MGAALPLKVPSHPVDNLSPSLGGMEVTQADPETAWGLWSRAVADLDAAVSRGNATTRPAALEEADDATRPMSLDEKTPEQRLNDALALLDDQHPRIAAAVRAVWGAPECLAYLNRLVLEGCDGSGRSRVGFSPRVVDALMNLADLHETLFGAAKPGGELGFADSTVRAGLEGVR